MTQLTSTGLQVSRLADRLTDLQAAVRAIFGADLDLSPNTIDGQTIGVYAEAMSNLDALLEVVYNSLSPQNATGATLSRLVQLNGVKRIPGTYSTVVAKLGGTVGTIIPAGTLLRSVTSLATFATDAQVTIDATGFAYPPATSTLIGNETAPAGSLTEISTPVYGLQTSTNVADAALGRDEETDGQLRIRRMASAAYPSQSVADGIYSAIANLAGVTHAAVYDNDQPITDPVTGQAKNSIYAVVQGGLEADIVQALFLKKPVGIPTVGALGVPVADSQGHLHTIRYARPVQDAIYVKVTLSARPGFPADGVQQIKDAIAAYGTANYAIGQEVVQSDFYTAIAAIPGKSVASILIGLVNPPVSGANLATAYDHLAVFDVSRVLVTLV